jgi:hypothetical protein
MRWVICTAQEAAPEGNAEEAGLFMRLLDSKARPGTPTILFILDSSTKSVEFEERVFKDESVVLGSLFFTNLKLALMPPIGIEQSKKLTGGKGAAIILFDGERKEVKRFVGTNTSPANVFQAMSGPVRKARGVSLESFVSQEQKHLSDLDKAFADYTKIKGELDALAANPDTSGTRRKMDELNQRLLDTSAHIKALQAREKAHIETATRR